MPCLLNHPSNLSMTMEDTKGSTTFMWLSFTAHSSGLPGQAFSEILLLSSRGELAFQHQLYILFHLVIVLDSIVQELFCTVARLPCLWYQ